MYADPGERRACADVNSRPGCQSLESPTMTSCSLASWLLSLGASSKLSTCSRRHGAPGTPPPHPNAARHAQRANASRGERPPTCRELWMTVPTMMSSEVADSEAPSADRHAASNTCAATAKHPSASPPCAAAKDQQHRARQPAGKLSSAWCRAPGLALRRRRKGDSCPSLRWPRALTQNLQRISCACTCCSVGSPGTTPLMPTFTCTARGHARKGRGGDATTSGPARTTAPCPALNPYNWLSDPSG